METVWNIESICLTEDEYIEIEWKKQWPLPAQGDCVDLLYYLTRQQQEELCNSIVKASPEISEEFQGKSYASILSTYFLIVKRRMFLGRNYGIMFKCRLSLRG